MKTALALLTAFGFLQAVLCQEEKKNETNPTNVVSTLALFRKTPLLGPSPKLSFDASALLSERAIKVVFPRIGTNRLLTLRPFQWDAPPRSIAADEWGKEKEAQSLFASKERESLPDLYYFHSDRLTGSDEQSDIFGKVLLLQPQTSNKWKWIVPLIKWDISSAIGERVTFGVGFTGEFP